MLFVNTGLIITFVKIIITDMKNRLEEFLRLEGLTSVKFAEIMQIQPSSVSHILSGRNNPNFDFVSRMLQRFPNLNPDWFINGIGNVYRSKQNTESPEITNVTRNNDGRKGSTNDSYKEVNEIISSSKSVNSNMITNVNNDHLHQVKSQAEYSQLNLDLKSYNTPTLQTQNAYNEQYNNYKKQESSTTVTDPLEILANESLANFKGLDKHKKQITKIVFFYSDSTCSVFDVE